MSRPRSEQPTPGELEVLKILWACGPCTARHVWERLDQEPKRHYTSVNSLLNTMTDKGLLARHTEGRAFVFEAVVAREKTLAQLVEDLMGRAFEGSPGGLVLQVLGHCDPSPEEMDEIAEIIQRYRKQRGKK